MRLGHLLRREDMQPEGYDHDGGGAHDGRGHDPHRDPRCITDAPLIIKPRTATIIA